MVVQLHAEAQTRVTDFLERMLGYNDDYQVVYVHH